MLIQKFHRVTAVIAIKLAQYLFIPKTLNSKLTSSTFKIKPIKQMVLNFNSRFNCWRDPGWRLEISPKVHKSFHKKLLIIANSPATIRLRVSSKLRISDSTYKTPIRSEER